MKNRFLKRTLCLFTAMVIMCTSLLVCSFALAEGETLSAEKIVSAMSLKQKIAQMIMPAMRTWNGVSSNVFNDEQIAALKEFQFGGIVLFGDNISSTEQTVRLTDSIQKAAKDSGSIPMFIAADQEGGIVTRLVSGTSMPGNMALAATGSTELTAQSAQIIGKELNAVGINVDFAPDTDVNTNPSNPVIGIRAFSDDTQTVVEYESAYINGLEDAGVIATAKHFPGHGDTDVDSHVGLPLVNKTYEQLSNSDLIPFKAAVEDGVDWIMTAHIQFPLIETDTYISIKDNETPVYLPATLSDDIIDGVLRKKLGYDGIISTDGMEMGALIDNFDINDTARLAINAGVDVLLAPVDLTDSQGVENMRKYIQDIENMAISGQINIENINESALRIVKLKIERGLFAQDDLGLEQRIENALQTVGSAENHAAEREISAKAVTVIQNKEETLPLLKDENQTILFACNTENEINSFNYGIKRLKDEKYLPEGIKTVGVSFAKGENLDKIFAQIEKCSYCIVTSKIVSESDLSPESWKSGSVDKIIAYAHEKGKRVVVISEYNPYDTARYPDADAICAIYGSISVAQLDENGNPVGKYGPNLPASLDVLFGKTAPNGTLPVNIMKIGNDYKFTNEILYARGYGITSFEPEKDEENNNDSPKTGEYGGVFFAIACLVSAAAVLFINRKTAR